MSNEYPQHQPDAEKTAPNLFDETLHERLITHEPAFAATRSMYATASALDAALRADDELGMHALTRRFITRWDDGEGVFDFAHDKIELEPKSHNVHIANVEKIVLRLTRDQNDRIGKATAVTLEFDGDAVHAVLTPFSYEIVKDVSEDLVVINQELVGTKDRREDPQFNANFFAAMLEGFEPVAHRAA